MSKILITNDDGILSEGLIRLAKNAKKFGEVWVVAPDKERSGVSHAVHFREPVEAWRVDFPVEGAAAFACSGTPGDCVRIGVLNIVPGKPDFVFSGINYGYNVASDLQYSATAGGAFEASFQGVHTIAFSEDANPDHRVTDMYIEGITERLMKEPPRANTIWSVNFPCCDPETLKGTLWDTTVSPGVLFEDIYEETKISDTRTAYMVKGIRKYEAEEGTDLFAVLNNYISVGVARNVI